jgi:hypothetical protein
MSRYIGSDILPTGEEILSGAVLSVHVPLNWTGEYVSYRLVEAFKVLRSAEVRGGHTGKVGFWPQYHHEFEDLRGWADEYRAEVEAKMARLAQRPNRFDLSLMDEALAWPLRFLLDKPMLADAITLWAWTTAYEIDLAAVLKKRKHHAIAVAQSIAAEINGQRARERAALAEQWKQWALSEFEARGVNAMTPKRKEKEVQRIRKLARAKLEREFSKLRDVKANATLGMPGRVLAVRTVMESKREALELLAERLQAAAVAVR